MQMKIKCFCCSKSSCIVFSVRLWIPEFEYSNSRKGKINKIDKRIHLMSMKSFIWNNVCLCFFLLVRNLFPSLKFYYVLILKMKFSTLVFGFDGKVITSWMRCSCACMCVCWIKYTYLNSSIKYLLCNNQRMIFASVLLSLLLFPYFRHFWTD